MCNVDVSFTRDLKFQKILVISVENRMDCKIASTPVSAIILLKICSYRCICLSLLFLREEQIRREFDDN